MTRTGFAFAGSRRRGSVVLRAWLDRAGAARVTVLVPHAPASAVASS